MDNREIGPGDIVYDETEKRSHVIRRIIDSVIYLYDDQEDHEEDDHEEDDPQFAVVFQEDPNSSGGTEGRWILRNKPDNILSFRPAPGKISLEGLSIENGHKFFIQIEVLNGSTGYDDDDWEVYEDERILFDSKEQAIEYYESFSRQYLELFEFPEESQILEKINPALYRAWQTQPVVDSPVEISTSIVFYTDQLNRKGEIDMDSEIYDFYRIRIVKIPYMSGSPMIKSSSKR